jgi:hypothetical protein
MTDMKITAKAKDGTTFEQEFSFGVGTMADSARDFVEKALNDAGWSVSNQGMAGITITGTKKGSPITEVDGGFKAGGNGAAVGVSNDSTQGVKVGTAVVGQAYQFAFLPLNPNSTTLDQSGMLTVVLNGTSYKTTVTAGMGPSQVEQALYSSLQKADVPVSFDTSSDLVSVAFDAKGNRVVDTLITLNAPGLEAETIIPLLSAVPEPSALVLGASAILIGLSCRWQRHRRSLLHGSIVRRFVGHGPFSGLVAGQRR